MTLRLAPYPEYERTTANWVGSVPAHWGDEPGFAVLREKQTKNLGLVETRVLSLSYGRIIVKPAEKLRGLVPDSFETYQIVERGDIIIRPTDLQNDRTSLRVGQVPQRGIITSAYLCLQPQPPLLADYAYRLLHTYDEMKVFYGLGSGLRQNLDFGDFKRLPIPVPPREEQHAIVAFLAHTERRINKLIRAKRRMIELLQEQKQAIINRAVTRGIDPNVQLKPSRVEWLGDVPEGWEVRRLKHATSFIVDCLHATPRYDANGSFPAIRTADVEPGRVRLETARRIDAGEYARWTQRAEPSEGDILYSREGERYGIAAPVPAATKLCISQRMMHFRAARDVHSGFLMWQLNCRSLHAQASADVVGATSPHVNVETIRNFWLALPPLEDQAAIADSIDCETSRLDEGTRVARRQIDLLREYRTRLIADVVTGKLDVRGVELPPLDDDGEPLDDAGVGDDEVEVALDEEEADGD